MPTDSLQVSNSPAATQLVTAGDGPTLIANAGPNTVWIGDYNTIQYTDGSGVVPLTPNSTYAASGQADVYATAAPGLPSTVYTIAGGLNFFQPVTSITLPTGATSGERIVLNGLTGTITGYNSTSEGPTSGVAFIISPAGMFFYE
jgi:hypothetical protein